MAIHSRCYPNCRWRIVAHSGIARPPSPSFTPTPHSHRWWGWRVWRRVWEWRRRRLGYFNNVNVNLYLCRTSRNLLKRGMRGKEWTYLKWNWRGNPCRELGSASKSEIMGRAYNIPLPPSLTRLKLDQAFNQQCTSCVHSKLNLVKNSINQATLPSGRNWLFKLLINNRVWGENIQ